MKRKEIKRKAKKVMKRHYGLLIVICLLSALLAGNLSSTFSTVQTSNESASLPSQLSANEVLQNLIEEDLDAGKLLRIRFNRKKFNQIPVLFLVEPTV